MPRNPDYNGAQQDDVAYYQRTIRNGRRHSAAAGYLDTVRNRPNLHVVTGAHVLRLNVAGRAVSGVTYRRGGGVHQARAAVKTLLCAESVNSPHLLQISGTGPAGRLRDLGITPLHDLPGVGEGLQDHFATRVAHRVVGSKTRIAPRTRQVSRAHIAKFRELPVANVSDCMSRLTAGGTRLRLIHASGVMSGPALTVRTRPGDKLMVHKALDMAEPGDVVVVDAGGDLTNATIGELMQSYAIQRGLGGLVINGAVRDVGALRRGELPVFAAGVTHRGPYNDGPGEINVPIAIDGMVIAPGDLMIGDDDGVLCVPFDQVDAVFEAASAKQAAEVGQMADILAGRSDRTWLDATLRRLGCDIGR